MTILKSGGHILGAKLTNSEQKALDIEVRKSLLEHAKQHENEFDALVLWQLHEQFGFGKERLWRLYKGFNKGIRELLKKYEMDENDDIWMATKRLKEYGIDLEKWAEKVKKEG